MVEPAETDLAALAEDASVTPLSLYQAALASLKLGSQTRYQEFFRELAERAKSDSSANDCQWIAWTNAQAPQSLADYVPAVAAARRGLTLLPHSISSHRNLGGLLFRSDQLDEALVHLTAAISALDANEIHTAYCSFFLAMNHHRLGHAEEAKEWFEKATESAKKLLDSGHADRMGPLVWNQKLTLQLLQTEAASLLQSNDPGSAPQEAGDSQP